MPNREEKIAALISWRSTPAALRDIPSLRQLALQLGTSPDGDFYALASSSEVLRGMLGISGIMAAEHLPRVLERLGGMAERGDLKAAEIFLDYMVEFGRLSQPE